MRASTVTWRSSIASSSADCVFGDARLISSASTTCANTPPGRNSNSFVPRFHTETPSTSDGSRSGVNWMRLRGRGDRARDRLGERRLADAGHVLDEEVAFGEQADEREPDLLALALDDALDVGEERVEERRRRRRRGDGEQRAAPGLHAGDGSRRARRYRARRCGATRTAARRRGSGGVAASRRGRSSGARRSRVGGCGSSRPRWWRRPPFLPAARPRVRRASGSRPSTAAAAPRAPRPRHLPRVVPRAATPSSAGRTDRPRR